MKLNPVPQQAGVINGALSGMGRETALQVAKHGAAPWHDTWNRVGRCRCAGLALTQG